METLKRIALYCYLGISLLVIFDPFLRCLPANTPPSSEVARTVVKGHRALTNPNAASVLPPERLPLVLGGR
jgi:hypothetical protein